MAVAARHRARAHSARTLLRRLDGAARHLGPNDGRAMAGFAGAGALDDPHAGGRVRACVRGAALGPARLRPHARPAGRRRAAGARRRDAACRRERARRAQALPRTLGDQLCRTATRLSTIPLTWSSWAPAAPDCERPWAWSRRGSTPPASPRSFGRAVTPLRRNAASAPP